MRATSFLAALALAAGAAAHATFQDLWINGVDQAGTCVRPAASNSPVTSVSTNDLACNVNGNIPAKSTCKVNAGDILAAEMHQQAGDRSCSNEAIGGDHFGPTLIYMAKVSSAATATTPWTAGWFKVNNTGLITANPQYWATQDMNANCGKVYFKVPSDIAPGDYLVRAEVIALHVAGSAGGAQFYMGCFQITVSGSGSASPATVSFPGAYKSTDPGILINIHTTLSGYTIPGPAVYGGGGSSAPKPSTSPATTAPSTTTGTVTKPSGTSTSPVATGSAVAQYGQCGGTNYQGSTTCAAGFKCVGVSVPYYYQCQ